MKACWPEGSLRAYHDGELRPQDMELVAAHLAECPRCEALADEVAGRADRVARLMGALPAPEQVIWMPRRPVAAPAPRRRVVAWPVWAGAAVALAAGLAIAAWMSPKAVKQPAPVIRATVEAPAPEPEATAAVPIILPAARPAKARTAAMRPARKQPVNKQVFLSLDDEPFETGIVMRVALGDAGIPADVIFGADGRAHAIRLVSDRE